MTEGLPFLILAVGLALAFEFVNGFHDTANAVATVIYTRSLKSHLAVIFSGLLNFLGVMLAGVGVAYSIVHLFPAQAYTGPSSLALIFSVLAAAIIWNLATWSVGIPASSSHALIGSIVGASMAYCTLNGLPLATGVPWDKARGVVAALLFSPLLGFGCSALMLYLMRRFASNRELFSAPRGDQAPPGWVRGLLIATCGGVSFAHGSNDGQKGMGLIMLILMGLAPAGYCLNLAASQEANRPVAQACEQAALALPAEHTLAGFDLEQAVRHLEGYQGIPAALRASLLYSAQVWRSPLAQLPENQRAEFRRLSLLQVVTLERAARELDLTAEQRLILRQTASVIQERLQYVATWVKLAVALALGLGTMVGWKRIVLTVGEKIGKTHLNYAQGVTAQLVAAATILLADRFHMPVSTTHVLSSGVAGAMHAQGSGLQGRTLMHIAMAWVLTLPVCVTLGFGLFLLLSR